MKNGKCIGMAIFVVGLLIIVGYGLYEGFQKISFEDLNLIVASGFIITIIGLFVLFISIIFEQQEGKKKMNKEISKEDLEP